MSPVPKDPTLIWGRTLWLGTGPFEVARSYLQYDYYTQTGLGAVWAFLLTCPQTLQGSKFPSLRGSTFAFSKLYMDVTFL